MNTVAFVEDTQRITIAEDMYKFVAIWAGLTALTAATFFSAYMRGRRRMKKAEEATFEAMRQDSAGLAAVPLSLTGGFARPGAA